SFCGQSQLVQSKRSFECVETVCEHDAVIRLRLDVEQNVLGRQKPIHPLGVEPTFGDAFPSWADTVVDNGLLRLVEKEQRRRDLHPKRFVQTFAKPEPKGEVVVVYFGRLADTLKSRLPPKLQPRVFPSKIRKS